MFLKFHFHILDISPCGCFIQKKEKILSKSVRVTSKKLKSVQYFRFAISYCWIFRKSGMSDMWYFGSIDKVPRQSPIDLQRQNFRTFFPLNFTKENRFFHVGIFNGLRKKFWLIVAPLPQCVRRLQNKTNLENIYTITDCCWSLHQLQKLRDKYISNLNEKESKIINFILFKKLRLFRPKQDSSAHHGKLIKNARRVQPFMLIL